MARSRLTPRAEAQLYAIWADIAVHSPRAADGLFERIMKRIRLGAEMPMMGSPRPELSATARILIEGPYILIYEPQMDGILIVAIVHGAREPSTWLD